MLSSNVHCPRIKLPLALPYTTANTSLARRGKKARARTSLSNGYECQLAIAKSLGVTDAAVAPLSQTAVLASAWTTKYAPF
jgi:hypothetical protein